MFGSLRVETHCPFSFFARSPPLAKTHEMPLRQSWPPMKKPEKFSVPRGFFCGDGLHRGVELLERRRLGDAGLLPHVGAREDVARAEVVGEGVLLAVDRARLDEAGEQLGTAELVVHVGDVEEGADVGEGRALGVAELDDVGAVGGVREGRRQLGDEVTPRLLLDGQGRAGPALEGVDEVGAQLVAGVTPGEPEGDGLARVGRRVGRGRRVGGCATTAGACREDERRAGQRDEGEAPSHVGLPFGRWGVGAPVGAVWWC